MFFSKKLLLSIFFFTTFTASAINITLVNPSTKSDRFWNRVTEISQHSADDLKINLTVHYAENIYGQTKLLQKLTQEKTKPDYMIFMPFGGSVVKSFNRISAANIPFVTIGRVYSKEEKAIIGSPQEKYPLWLGEMYHENAIYGEILATELINIAKKSFNNEEVLTAVGLKGDNYSESIEKGEGFLQAVQKSPNVIVHQVIPAKWNRMIAKQKLTELFSRYGQSHIIWTASDEMALGAIEAIENMGLDPKNFVIGGFDWLPEAITAIEEGKMKASIGGHYFQGAWAIIKTFDHANGLNVFKKGDNSAYLTLSIINQENVAKYKTLGGHPNYGDVDYSLFSQSKTNNTRYSFYASEVAKQLEKKLNNK